MHTFKKYEGVTFDDSGRINHGTIESIENGRATLYYYHLDFPWNADHITLPLDKLEFVPPIILTFEQIRKLCRYELRWSDIKRGYPDYTFVFFEKGKFPLTVEDIKTALQNIRVSRDDNQTIYDDWYYPLQDYIFNYIDSFEMENGLRQFFDNYFTQYDDIYDMLMSDTPFQNEIDQILEWFNSYL